MADSEFINQLDPQQVTDEATALFDLGLDDDKLVKLLVDELDKDVGHWNEKPWRLQETDEQNIKYYLGDQLDLSQFLPHQAPYIDNRLFTSIRAILAYVCGQLAKPSILPSKTDDKYQRISRQMEETLYQHARDHDVNEQLKLAVKNLLVRKRGILKLRFDEYYGPFGDICTENVDPADVVVSRYARFGCDPDRVYLRQKCTIEELISKFPDKKAKILAYFSVVREVHSQMSRMITYWECWFSYWDKTKKQGLAWFLPNAAWLLGKMENPNWIYTGDSTQERLINMTFEPVKPFIWLNYVSTGRSYIDETCLVDQAMPLQNILNKRGRQIVENADYANPRTLVDKRVMNEADANRFINKHPKTIGLVDTTSTANDIEKSVKVIPGQQLPDFVLSDKFDTRNEIDVMMGTPNVFRGEQPTGKRNPTLGQDMLIKNQAGALQDDLVRVVDNAMAQYYTYLLQMMKVYLPDDYWLMTKGGKGEYAKIVLSSDQLDTNVRISIQTDSTLPLDKQSLRATALQLAQIPGRIDDLSLYEMLGLPDPEKLAERVQRYNLDRMTYMESIEQKLWNAEAESDITLLINGRQPEDRDNYSEDYLNYWNMFMTTNRFMKLPTGIQQELTRYLQMIADKAAVTEAMRDSMLNPAGILDRPPMPKAPDVRVFGQLDSERAAQLLGMPPKPTGSQPPAEAQSGSQGGSNPRIKNPTQFTQGP